MDNFSDHYCYDEQRGIWQRQNAAPFAYSDGDDFENTLYEALRELGDVSVHSDALLSLQTDWPSTYHLSCQRSNLLRPLEKTLLRGSRVLELGCGCGALTRYLAETASSVVAVEGSPQRAGIASLRCKSLDNAAFITDKIQDLPPSLGQFDVVTLIGVLEYARVYGGGAGAEQRLLEKSRSFLRPGGVLILALENKMGLKYLAGVPEDHLGRSWAGVMDTYTDHSVVTFSRKELQNLLIEAGFSCVEQFVAIPDYKLPTTILHPAGLAADEKQLRKESLFTLRLRPFENPPLFNTQQTWRSVCKAGLLADLADSLCFIGVNSEEEQKTLHIWPENILASHYGSPPAKQYAKEVLIKNEADEIKVIRRSLYSDLEDKNAIFRQCLANEPYVQGEMLFERLRQVLLQKSWTVQQLADVLHPWTTWLSSHIIPGTDQVPSALIDAAPFNIILGKKGSLAFIDQEWSGEQTLSIAAIILRTLVNSFSIASPVCAPEEKKSLYFIELITELLCILQIPFKERQVDDIISEAYLLDKYLFLSCPSLEVIKKEKMVCMVENSSCVYTLHDTINHLMDSTEELCGNFNRVKFELEQVQAVLEQKKYALEQMQSILEQTQGELERTQSELERTQSELERTQSALEQTQNALGQTREELACLLNSNSWLATKPLRLIGKFIRKKLNVN